MQKYFYTLFPKIRMTIIPGIAGTFSVCTFHSKKCSQKCSDNTSYGLVNFNQGFPGKESICNAGFLGSIPGLGRSPGGEHGNPLQYSCLENPHGHSPMGLQRVDRTEQLSKAKQNFNQAKRLFKSLT